MLLALLGVCDASDRNAVYSCRIESCSGWKLNRFPDVKRFLNQVVPLYHNVEVRWIGGANPDALFLNEYNEMVESVDLTKFKFEQMDEIFLSRGFFKKEDMDDVVPAGKRRGPYYVFGKSGGVSESTTDEEEEKPEASPSTEEPSDSEAEDSDDEERNEL